MSPYNRNGHLAMDNCMATYCRRCGRSSSLWSVPCDNQPCKEAEYDEFGYRTRTTT